MKKNIAIWDAYQQISENAIKNIIEDQDANLLMFGIKDNAYPELENHPHVTFINSQANHVAFLYESLQNIESINQFIIIDKQFTEEFVFAGPDDIANHINNDFKQPIVLFRRLLPLLAKKTPDSLHSFVKLFQVNNNGDVSSSPLDTYFKNLLADIPFSHLLYRSEVVSDKSRNLFGQFIVDALHEDNNYDAVAIANANANDYEIDADVMADLLEGHNQSMDSTFEEPKVDEPRSLPNSHKVEGQPFVPAPFSNPNAIYDNDVPASVPLPITEATNTLPDSIQPHVQAVAQTVDEVAAPTSPLDNLSSAAPVYGDSYDYSQASATPASADAYPVAPVTEADTAPEILDDLQQKINRLKQAYNSELANKINIITGHTTDFSDTANTFKEQAMSMAKAPVAESNADTEQNKLDGYESPTHDSEYGSSSHSTTAEVEAPITTAPPEEKAPKPRMSPQELSAFIEYQTQQRALAEQSSKIYGQDNNAEQQQPSEDKGDGLISQFKSMWKR